MKTPPAAGDAGFGWNYDWEMGPGHLSRNPLGG